MASAIKDKVKGALRETKGKAKEAAGKITDNPKLQGKGAAEKVAGKAQRKLGEIKTVLGK